MLRRKRLGDRKFEVEIGNKMILSLENRRTRPEIPNTKIADQFYNIFSCNTQRQ